MPIVISWSVLANHLRTPTASNGGTAGSQESNGVFKPGPRLQSSRWPASIPPLHLLIMSCSDKSP